MYALYKELLGWKMSQSLVKLSGEGGGMTFSLLQVNAGRIHFL